MDTTFIDAQIYLIASGATTVPREIIDSLSASSVANEDESNSLCRLTSVKQKSALLAANLLVEGRLMKKQKQLQKEKDIMKKNKKSIRTMDGSQLKLYRSVITENSSLKRKYTEIKEKYETLMKSKCKLSDDLDKATLSAMSSFTRTNITSAEWHKANPKFAHYWLGFSSWGDSVSVLSWVYFCSSFTISVYGQKFQLMYFIQISTYQTSSRAS